MHVFSAFGIEDVGDPMQGTLQVQLRRTILHSSGGRLQVTIERLQLTAEERADVITVGHVEPKPFQLVKRIGRPCSVSLVITGGGSTPLVRPSR